MSSIFLPLISLNFPQAALIPPSTRRAPIAIYSYQTHDVKKHLREAPMVEISDYILAIARKRALSPGRRKNSMSQPNLSQFLKFRGVHRNRPVLPHPLRVSPHLCRGRLFLEKIQEIDRSYRRPWGAQADADAELGVIRFGSGGQACYWYSLGFILSSTRNFPQITVSITEANSRLLEK